MYFYMNKIKNNIYLNPDSIERQTLFFVVTTFTIKNILSY